MDVQIVVVLSNVCQGNRHDVFPERTIARPALLQGKGSFMCPLGKGGIFFAPSGCGRVDGFQFCDGEGGFLWIGSSETAVKITQCGLLILQAGDDQTHL